MNGLYPWQRRAWRKLDARRRKGAIPHALLIHGRPGLGKREYAQYFARQLLCSAPDGDRDGPCGQCQDCRLFLAGSHPEFLEVEPAEEGRSIRTEQVREIGNFVSLRSQHGRGYKVAILYPAEAMNKNAANALLKTLEEPPPGTILILVSHAPSRLRPTVRSRCQFLAFHTPRRDEALSWLSGQVPQAVDPDLALRLSGQSPLRALALCQGDSLQQRALWLSTLQELLEGRSDPTAVAGQWEKIGLPRIQEWTSSLATDLVHLRSRSMEGSLVNIDMLDNLRPLSRRLDFRLLFSLYDWCLQIRGALDRSVALKASYQLQELAILWTGGGVTTSRHEYLLTGSD